VKVAGVSPSDGGPGAAGVFELEDGVRVIVRDMLPIARATDLFLGDLTRRGYSQRTVDTYKRLLDKLSDFVPVDTDVGQVTQDDCRRFLDQWNKRSAGTRAHTYAVLSSFFKWLYRAEKIKRNPMERLEKPRRIPAEDLDVVSVSADDVRRLLEAAEGWTEKLAVAIPAYLGARRHAIAVLRFGDYDEVRGRIRFREKGGKTIWKPVPTDLGRMIDAAKADGTYSSADDYLVPPEGPLNRSGVRDDRVIWRVLGKVADRAGVKAHVHSLRAAFAVFYLEQNPGDVESLKELLGHKSLTTTQVYLRKLDKGAAMERVRTLSWGSDALGGIGSSGGGRI
jgi:integrase